MMSSSTERERDQTERNWPDLPSDILLSVMERLTIIDDYIRFGATCIPWRTSFLLNNQSPAKKPLSGFFPFLLVPVPKSPLPFTTSSLSSDTRKRKRGDEKIEARRWLYNISREKVYDFQLQVPHDEHCRGSSFGWLITMKCNGYDGLKKVKYYVQLRNPFLPKPYIIRLPSLPLLSIESRRGDGESLLYPFAYLRKAVLSAQPDNIHNKNFVVMAIISQFSRLAYFKPTTKASFRWTPIGDWSIWKNFDDLIYFSKTKLFYAVLHDTGEVFAIDTEKPLEFKQVAPFIKKSKLVYNFHRYIVESPAGDLLQVVEEEQVVIRNFRWNIPAEDLVEVLEEEEVINHHNRNWNVKFEVFKFDPNVGVWIQIHSIGDVILFSGANSIICRSTSDFSNCKSNCIYFTNKRAIECRGLNSSYNLREMGIYNLDNGTILPFLSTVPDAPLATTPIWLEPTVM